MSRTTDPLTREEWAQIVPGDTAELNDCGAGMVNRIFAINPVTNKMQAFRESGEISGNQLDPALYIPTGKTLDRLRPEVPAVGSKWMASDTGGVICIVERIDDHHVITNNCSFTISDFYTYHTPYIEPEPTPEPEKPKPIDAIREYMEGPLWGKSRALTALCQWVIDQEGAK